MNQQPLTHFRSANNQGLLIYLALNAKRPQPREALASLFWPEEPDKNARNNLRQSLFQLRSIVGDTKKQEQPFLLVTRQTVQFNPESSYRLDVHEFLAAIDENDLESAVSYYQGELLPGFTCDSLEFEEWLRQEREQLHRLGLETMFELTQAYLDNGRFSEAQAVAQQQLALEPWREQAHRQLMQAFALAGDRNNALIQYETCRNLLLKELGLEPAPETTALFEEIQSGRFGPCEEIDTVRPPARTRNNLPADTTPFIGRELELTHIRRLLKDDGQRLVTIVGPGGMGKTRLALALGESLLEAFEDGVYFVDLTAYSKPADIAPAIADALDYQPPDKTQTISPQLVAGLSRQHLLLILDNFEHILEGAAFANEIIHTCSSVSILATSRQRLNLASETRYELGGLDYPQTLSLEAAMKYTAVQLFVDSGRRARPQFELTAANIKDVVQVCQLVQGMPLALVLAAAWLEMLTTAEIAAEVAYCFDFLAADLVDLPPRQRSIFAVFDRSWQRMNAEEQALLAKLSVFRGGFTREAAEQVAGANLRLLLSLVNKSLIRRQPESGRFVIHELLRQFAARKLRQFGTDQEISLAHSQYFATLMAKETYEAANMYPMHLANKFQADRENIRRAWDAALEQGLVDALSGMARGMAVISYSQGQQPDKLLREAVHTLRELGTPETDVSMLDLKLVELNVRREHDSFEKIQLEFLDLIRVIEGSGNLELLYWAYDCMAFLGMNDSDLEAIRWHEKSYEVAVEMNAARLIKRTQAVTLWILIDSGVQVDHIPAPLKDMDHESRSDQLQGLLDYFEKRFSHSFIYYGLLLAITIHNLDSKAIDEAIYYGKKALNIAKGWRDLYWIAFASERLANIYFKIGREAQGKAYLLDTIEWHLAIGQVWQTLGYLWSMTIKYSQLMGGDEAAVSILAMVYYHPEATPYYKQEVEKARTQFQEKMEEEAYVSAWAKGKRLDFETAVALLRENLK